jgi:hypothetical protein
MYADANSHSKWTEYWGADQAVYRGDRTYDVEIHFSPDAADLVTETTVPDWKEAVVQGFNLQGRRFKPLFDEHEQRLPGDVRALARVLGSFLARSDLMPGQ